MENKQKVFFKTFGCRTNLFDSQIMISNLKDFKHTLEEKEADIVIINSCTVTNGADSTVRSYINGLKKNLKKQRVVFTGCGIWTKGEDLFSKNKIDSLFGHSEKEKINSLLLNENRFFEAGNLDHIDNTIINEMIGKSRAFVKIQEGCDFRCSYCVIPYVRGDARSYNEDKILEQIRILASNGFGEFILSGTNIGSYNGSRSDIIKGKKGGLAHLLKKISLIRGVRRIRLGSVEPIQITDEFKEILCENWFSKHLHIALQHTSAKMLAIMNRRNKINRDLELFNYISSKGYALGTDFIVGHPGETEKIWDEAIDNFMKFPITHIHAFTYSKRDGTPSANMKGTIDGKLTKNRIQQINDIVNKKNHTFRSNKKELEVLIESRKDNNKNIYKGYDQFFNKVEVSSNIDIIGDWITLNDYNALGDINIAKF